MDENRELKLLRMIEQLAIQREQLAEVVQSVASTLHAVWRCNTDEERQALGMTVGEAIGRWDKYSSHIIQDVNMVAPVDLTTTDKPGLEIGPTSDTSFRRLTRPGDPCGVCGAIMGESLVCPACQYVDPPAGAVSKPSPVVSEHEGGTSFGAFLTTDFYVCQEDGQVIHTDFWDQHVEDDQTIKAMQNLS